LRYPLSRGPNLVSSPVREAESWRVLALRNLDVFAAHVPNELSVRRRDQHTRDTPFIEPGAHLRGRPRASYGSRPIQHDIRCERVAVPNEIGWSQPSQDHVPFVDDDRQRSAPFLNDAKHLAHVIARCTCRYVCAGNIRGPNDSCLRALNW
jgi:hypothetical protein